MPAKGRAPRRQTTVTNPEQGQPEPLIAKGMRLQKLDGDGQPIGEPVQMPDATVSIGTLQPGEGVAVELPATGSVSAEFEVTTKDKPELAELVKELMRIPIPTAIIDRWFPAFVRWPGETQPLSRCKVFLTPQGLYVYTAVPTQPETFADGARPDRYATIRFEETSKPPLGTVARNAGIRIQTVAGPVIVQPTGGCGCGSRLKHWSPTWTGRTISWEDGVKLAAEAAGR